MRKDLAQPGLPGASSQWMYSLSPFSPSVGTEGQLVIPGPRKPAHPLGVAPILPTLRHHPSGQPALSFPALPSPGSLCIPAGARPSAFPEAGLTPQGDRGAQGTRLLIGIQRLSEGREHPGRAPRFVVRSDFVASPRGHSPLPESPGTDTTNVEGGLSPASLWLFQMSQPLGISQLRSL